MTETSSFYGNNPTPSEIQSAEDILAQAVASIDLVLNSSAAAAQSAVNASTSAINAASSASAASASAALASTNGANATTDAATASTQAAAAAQSAADAAASASSITSSVTAATTKASEALTSANNANTARVAAESARDAADGSKTAAATSASNAATSASNAASAAASAASTAAASAVSSALTSYYDKTASDTRFAAKTHNHPISDVTGLQTILNGLSAIKKTELIDVTGLSQIDLTVPAGAVRCRLTFDFHASAASASITLRISTDGTTFHSGAAAYSFAYLVVNSLTNTVSAGSLGNGSGFPLSLAGDNTAVPITGTSLLSLVRPNTTRLFSWMSQAHVYDSATNGMRYSVLNGTLSAATTNDLAVQKVRILTTSGNWIAGTVLVEWF